MTDSRPGFTEAGPAGPGAEDSLGEVADRGIRRIVTALIIAGSIVGLAIYSRPGPPRYQAFANEGQIVRIDTRSGTVLACEQNQCWTVVRRGQRLKRNPAPAALPKPATPPQAPAAPTPRAAPSTS